MYNYDFTILHHNEFECFTRDLLQAHDGLQIESFAEGRDKGVDLRFAYDLTKKCIIQCKKYKDWNELKSGLKKEVKKVKLLNPDRYILSTSVDLTVANKDVIKDMFSPHIKNTTDILAKSDLNNLLAQHQEIEQQYYKLWLSSTNVLNIILHRNVINWSEFEKDEIKTEVGKYVFNDSFYEAADVLKKNRYVIISGIPGIGKTTLARMLVYDLLANGYEEFIYIINDLDKACEVYDKTKKQVFFFDDFLGANTFEPQGTGFENKLIHFINRIKQSQNSVFILTTREYVLSAAKSYYEKFNLNDIDVAKCTIEMKHYSTSIRAQILCNHLIEAKIPIRFVSALLINKGYRKLIQHQNFNPRVIEGFIKKKMWENVTPENFMNFFLDFFDQPLAVWESAFSKLDIHSRYALLVCTTLGKFTLLTVWQAAYKHFCKTTHAKLGLIYDDTKWLETVKILQDCFISTEKKYNNIYVTPFNPSITDFCASFIRNNTHTRDLLLSSSLLTEQVTNIFTDSIKPHTPMGNQVEIPHNHFPILKDTLTSILYLHSKDESMKRRFNTDECCNIITKFPIFSRSNESFIVQNFNFEDLRNKNVDPSKRFQIIRSIDWSFTPLKSNEILKNIAITETLTAAKWLDFINCAKELGLNDLLGDAKIQNSMMTQLQNEIDKVDYIYYCDQFETTINEIHELIPSLEIQPLLHDVDSIRKELEQQLKTRADLSEWQRKEKQQNIEIDDMFSSLLENYPNEEREQAIQMIQEKEKECNLDSDLPF